MRGESTILSPTQVGLYLKGMMERDSLLSGLLVRGEISNYKQYPSGHHYFTLKDAEGSIRCVMFRGDAMSLRFRLQNGMQVIVAGRVTVYPRDGQYQLYCVRMTPDGAGDLHLAFEQMKEKLMREGLFDRSIKSPFPPAPKPLPWSLLRQVPPFGICCVSLGHASLWRKCLFCRCVCRGKALPMRSPQPFAGQTIIRWQN